MMGFEWKLLNGEPFEKIIPRGSLLLFRDESWLKESVVLMVCEWVGDSECHHSFVRVTGSKGGINPLQLIPDSIINPESSITVGWLIKNWNKWIWVESECALVKVCYGPISVEYFE